MVMDGERRGAGTHAVRSGSAAAPQESAAGPDGQEQPTILVVDDEPELCFALSKLLRRNKYKVLTANNGEEALAVLRQQEVHLVLSDLLMPRVGGLELLKAAQVV